LAAQKEYSHEYYRRNRKKKLEYGRKYRAAKRAQIKARLPRLEAEISIGRWAAALRAFRSSNGSAKLSTKKKSARSS
jgi:hypothetical protein